MNYIRGAVNAITVPYQYYKDINPATLTGAIDVIVIQRPSDNGGTELACSPFHVRFGKWQVLRPNEKKVTVSVNGHAIPFDMKIGEAGEAFFIFETDDDVPDDLITSPLLRPSSPPNEKANGDVDAAHMETNRFGAKKDDEQPLDEPEPLDLNALPSPPVEDVQIGGTSNGNNNTNGITPERPTHRISASTSSASVAIDRPSSRARSSSLSVSTTNESALPSPPPSPTRTQVEKEQDERADAALKQTLRRVHVPEVKYQDGMALDAEGYHSHKSKSRKSSSKLSAHDRERSDRTIRGYEDDSMDLYTFPSRPKVDSDGRTSHPHTFGSSDSGSDSDDTVSNDTESDDNQRNLHAPSKSLTLPFPSRAISEPPPDLPFPSSSLSRSNLSSSSSLSATNSTRFSTPGKLNVLTPVQEYSWEWGAFPQPSPMKSSFGKGGRLDAGIGILGATEEDDQEYDLPSSHSRIPATWGRTSGRKGRGKGKESRFRLNTVDSEDDGDHPGARSRSVPPQLEESPTRDRSRRHPAGKRDDVEIDKKGNEHQGAVPTGVFGAGGRLSSSKSDPTLYRVYIEGRKFEFELSLVEYKGDSNEDDEVALGNDEEASRGRQARDAKGSQAKANNKKSASRIRVFSPDGRWAGIDEFETARLFEKGKISFDDFIENDGLVKDPRLVIKWTQQQFISRQDESPLMDALILWRTAYIKRKATARPSRPTSPSSALSEEEQEDDDPLSDTDAKKNVLERSKSEPPEALKEHGASGAKLPPPTSSSWVQWWRRSRKIANPPSATATSDVRPELKETISAPSNVGKLKKPALPEELMRGSAPALPSTPVQQPVLDRQPTPKTSPSSTPKKFAKTLRLTSDQLKSLNLKPGPNSITFSLSMSGAVACTARIFLWDSTDLVVVSDIDGTITKSDGLGHVFAMIGRDWTHVGVAKLYTDISRNGYKIMYLTSRAIGQADATRGYLKGIKQNDYQLPEGPVIMSPDRLMASLHREVIMRKPEVFKMACLRDIQRLFGEAARNPFYAGFGNRITDALSYRSVNVPSSRIFTIDSAGEVKCELLELAGYKSSYIHMTDLVDQQFPPIHQKWAPEFTDFNFWKQPMQDFPLPDFSPPSPALSARSDNSSSTFARLRNLSLIGNRQSNIPKAKTLAVAAAAAAASSASSSQHASDSEHPLRNATLQQMSSFERLSSTLGFSGSGRNSRRSESPDSRSYSSSSYAGSEDEDGEGQWRGGEKRERRRSMTSMPGSLDDMDFGEEEEEGEVQYEEPGYVGEYDNSEQEEMDSAAVDEAVDEDLLAADEMEKVPFL